jgi:hypothetical protein
MAVTGSNFVRFTRHGLQSIRSYWSRIGDRFEARRQAKKLKYWDERHNHDPGMLFDHSYESIKALSGLGIYEMRLDDDIGGQSNIRVVFLDPPKDWTPAKGEGRPLRVIWVLEIMPKRRDDWTKNDLTRFKGARLLIEQRFYN